MSTFSDDMYAILLSACDTVERGIRFVGEKGNEVWDSAKINGEIRQCKIRIETLYAEVGRLSRQYRGDPLAAGEAIDKLMREIDTLEEQIAELRRKAAEAGHSAQCPNPECSKNCEPGDAFCRGCGQAL